MTVTAQFQDRYEAGRFLATKLSHHANDPALLVLALPRGGVPAAYEIAKALHAPLDVFLVRKLGAPSCEELERRERIYRGERPPAAIEGRTVILVDDGLATGASMRAAVEAVREQRPKSVIVAVPIGSADTCGQLSHEADEVVCGMTPDPFYAVGAWYSDFLQITDEEVRQLLNHAAHERRVRQALAQMDRASRQADSLA